MRGHLTGSRRKGRRSMKACRWIGLVLAIVVVAMHLAATGCTGPTETREDSFTVGESVRLIVDSMNGSIEVNAGVENEVRIQATLEYPSKIEYEVSQDGNTITVSARKTGKYVLFGRGPGVDVIVTTPVKTDVDLDTSNGAIELYGIEGSGYLSTSNGKIVLDNVKGDFHGTTSNGRIEIDSMEGSAILSSSNGGVRAQGAKGEFDLQTTNGSISFSGELTAGGGNRLVTSNGSVNVELQGMASINLDASTSRGRVTSEFPITATTTKDNHLVGTIGNGEAALYIQTSNGNVTIR